MWGCAPPAPQHTAPRAVPGLQLLVAIAALLNAAFAHHVLPHDPVHQCV